MNGVIVGTIKAERADAARILSAILEPIAGPQRDGLAAALLERFGGLRQVLRAEEIELAELWPDAPLLAARFDTILDWAAVIAREEIGERNILATSEAIIAYCRIRIDDCRRERLLGLYLDRNCRLIGEKLLGVGVVNHVAVYPREIIRHALSFHASRIVLVHNHPAGDPTPGAFDLAMTHELAGIAAKLGIELADHIIISEGQAYGFREHGRLGGEVHAMSARRGNHAIGLA